MQSERPAAGRVYLVGAGPGDPGLLTLRGRDCLRQADVVVHDRLANGALLMHAARAKVIDVGKEPNHHPIPQERINEILIAEASQGQTVVRLKGGDPFLFGRGGEEAQALAAAGIPFEIVPGVTSALAVPAYAGIPVTQRGVASSVAVVAGHAAEGTQAGVDWAALARGADTLVVLMGMNNLASIIESLRAAGRAAATPAAVISEGTLPAQRTVVGTLGDIVEKARGLQPPAVIVIGEVVKLHDQLDWFQPAPSPVEE